MEDIGWLDRFWVRYGITIGSIGAAFLLRHVLVSYVGSGFPTYVTFYPAVMLIAMVFGLWAGLVATAMVALLASYWILPPQGQFAIENLSDVVGLCLFSVMCVFLSVVAEVYRRSRQRVRERTVELAKANEALRHLSSKLLSTQEEERKRIAGEIHDTLGSCLNGIKFKVGNALQQAGKDANVVTESLSAIIPVIQEGIEECRRMQMDLRPPMLDDLGLLTTLSWFCKRYETIYSGIKVELEQTLEERDIPDSLKIVIYRVTQEGMNNIAKHSKAEFVRLSLRKLGRRVELVLQDNGEGFDLEKMRSQEAMKKGLGLTNMRERVELSGGDFSIESSKGDGTVIRASWPLWSEKLKASIITRPVNYSIKKSTLQFQCPMSKMKL
jgi:signal transduction histidine kinase